MSAEKSFHIAVRVDGNSNIGLGHLSRCANVASYLHRLYGVQSTFLIGSDSVGIAEKIIAQVGGVKISVLDMENEVQSMIDAISSATYHLLLLDSYAFTELQCRKLKYSLPTLPIITFDDAGEKASYGVDGFVNYGLGADAGIYPEDKLSRSAIGPSYMPLKVDFIEARDVRKRDNVKCERLLITMGGSDPEHQIVRMARVARSISNIDAIDVILGPCYNTEDDIEGEIAGDSRFVIHRSPANYADLVSKAELAICGAGMSSCELMACGVPVVLLTLADNQRPMELAVRRYSCGLALGDYRLITDDEIREKIKGLVSDATVRNELISNGLARIDGKGGERLASFLMDFVTKYHSDAYSETEVRGEYERSSSADAEYQKLKWGSQEGMNNRFLIARRHVDWTNVSSWLDVGCGTGAFFREMGDSKQLSNCVGVDLSPSLLRNANTAQRLTCIDFKCQSFMDAVNGAPFDLVTCIGVLHKCGVPLRKAVARLAELVRPGGTVFATTKHRGWKKFECKDVEPYPGHHWYDLSELLEAFTNAGLGVENIRGFDPRIPLNECEPEEAHSVYIIAVRKQLNDS